MKFAATSWIVVLWSIGISAQVSKNLYPKIGRKPDFSEAAIQRFAFFDTLLVAKERTEEEQRLLDTLMVEFEGVNESIWDISGGGCSWYCGGGPYKVSSSSHLKPMGENSYEPSQAHDDSFKTAWVEGASGQGIGEHIDYYFKNNSPRLHTILIYNGLVKSDKAWKANSRVKTLKLWVNGEGFGTLHLQDTTALQIFSTGLLGHRPDGKDLILKFEILEVYPGEKYKDTAITELYFDGVDVH